ncbi:uncharacterized protein LOC116218008 [Scomber scombrus]|uniref:Uncharacterized protein LOC116218008 n=1 Tax=Scomber scombrus TaxID=13677 RepID=A0AAV1PSH5_SCOSC
MEKPRHRCSVCDKTFTEKSNLTRHLKIHAIARETFDWDVCRRSLTTKSSLVSHQQLHQYPNIVLYRQGEARLHCTEAAKSVAEAPSSTVVDPKWLDLKTAEAAVKRSGGELWKGQLVIVFGKYAGQTFRWLLENNVGWLVWLLFQYCQQGEQNELLKWQKERLLEYAREFPPVTWHLVRRLKKAHSKKDRAPPTVPDLSQQDPNYASDAELLAAAESVLDESEPSVSTHLTTWGDLASSVCQDDRPGPSSLRETSEPGAVPSCWHKFWEQPPESAQVAGMSPTNIKWLKTNEIYGLFERASTYKNSRGEMVERKVLKEKMEFHPPPSSYGHQGSCAKHALVLHHTCLLLAPGRRDEAVDPLPQQLPRTARVLPVEERETAMVMESILAEFRGQAGLDIDGIHLFKSPEALNAHWAVASKQLSCMQDPPGIQLYVSVKVVVMNGIRLNKYKCRRGSNSLEGLHAHLFNAVPSQRCGIMPFQSREEEELESTEQDNNDEADEGLSLSSDAEEDPIDRVGEKHVVLTQAEQAEEDSPALQDVFMTHRHLHLPGIEEVEALAVLLLELADDSDLLLVLADLRQKIAAAANALHEHDKTAARFVKRYESRATPCSVGVLGRTLLRPELIFFYLYLVVVREL